jgi:hypothetical protein
VPEYTSHALEPIPGARGPGLGRRRGRPGAIMSHIRMPRVPLAFRHWAAGGQLAAGASSGALGDPAPSRGTRGRPRCPQSSRGNSHLSPSHSSWPLAEKTREDLYKIVRFQENMKARTGCDRPFDDKTVDLLAA